MVSGDNPHETRDALPDKEVMYDSGAADLSHSEALMEIADNIIDNARRPPIQNNPKIVITYSKHYQDNTAVENLSIYDNTGGVKNEEDMDKFLSFGSRTEENMQNKLGAYGVGFKKAMRKLGKNIEIVSRYNESSADTYRLEVGESWFQRRDFKYELEYPPNGTIEKGATRVTFSDLNFDWDVEKDRFLSDLTNTYELYLRTDRVTEEYVPITIEFVDETQPEGEQSTVLSADHDSFDYHPIDWSYIPYAFYPRRFENICVSDGCDKQYDGPIYADITVGFTRGTSDERFGTHLYVQGRNILRNERGKKGGYGSKLPSHLKTLGGEVRNLQVIIELRATGDPSELPWNSVKNDIQENDELMIETFSWLKRIAEVYVNDGGRSSFRIGVYNPYTSDREESFDGDDGTGIEIHDYRDQKVVTHKPTDEDILELKRLVRRAEIHAAIGTRCKSNVPSELRPAYDSYLESLTDTTVLTTIRADDDIKSPLDRPPKDYVKEIQSLVDSTVSANRDRREDEWVVYDLTCLPTWGVPLYKSEIEFESGLEYDSLERSSTLPEPEPIPGPSGPIDEPVPDPTKPENRTLLSIRDSTVDDFLDTLGQADGELSGEFAVELLVESGIRHHNCSNCSPMVPLGLETKAEQDIWDVLEKRANFSLQQTTKGIGIKPCESNLRQADVLELCVETLLSEEFLTLEDLPFETGPKRNMINTEPTDKDGNQMADARKVREGVYIETKNSAHEKYTNLIKLVKFVASQQEDQPE